jgi:hypothetical protein
LLKECEEHDISFKAAFDENASETPSETPASASSRCAAAFEILVQFLTAVKAEPEEAFAKLSVVLGLVVGGVWFIGTWDRFRWTVRRIWDLWLLWQLLEDIKQTGIIITWYAKV